MRLFESEVGERVGAGRAPDGHQSFDLERLVAS
jgi:hypothetical protein